MDTCSLTGKGSTNGFFSIDCLICNYKTTDYNNLKARQLLEQMPDLSVSHCSLDVAANTTPCLLHAFKGISIQQCERVISLKNSHNNSNPGQFCHFAFTA